MSEALRSWLEGREPPPAFELAPWMEGADPTSREVAALGLLGRRALDRALAAPGRVRGSALHLLAADALITYACEAALEGEDPEGALTALLDEVSGR